jgi:hypothetical protein
VSPHEGYVKAVDKNSLLDSYNANDIEYEPGQGEGGGGH